MTVDVRAVSPPKFITQHADDGFLQVHRLPLSTSWAFDVKKIFHITHSIARFLCGELTVVSRRQWRPRLVIITMS